jgi:soluble lytic murein transglycosylase-like protein
MAVAVVPVTATVASAKSAPTYHARIQLAASLQPDHPEDFRTIPADPPPPPPVAPTPVPVAAKVPTPPAKPVAVVSRPVSVPASKAQIAAIIRAAAARYGVDGDRLLRVAMCESGLNPNARNASGAEGLFQFKPATFYGHGGHNIWDPADQSDVAARMFAQGLSGQWTCK